MQYTEIDKDTTIPMLTNIEDLIHEAQEKCLHALEELRELKNKIEEWKITKQNEIKKIIALMKIDYKSANDWNYVDDERVEIIDKKDRIIGIISSDRLTKYWNCIEG